MFDADLVEIFRSAIAEACRRHPDVLRSVVVNFDYYGTLNDAPGLQKGLYLGPHGTVRTPDAVIGAVKNLLESIAALLAIGQQMAGGLEQHLTKLQQDILQLQKANHGQESGEGQVG